MKKTISLFLALVLCVGLTVPALAANSDEIASENSEEIVFEDGEEIGSEDSEEIGSESRLELTPAVKYVYYSRELPATWQADAASLPGWLRAEGNVLYGMPTEAGEYPVTISDGADMKTITLTVRENGDNSVRTSISDGYVVAPALPDIIEADATWVIKDVRSSASDAPDISARLLDVYLDGHRLTGGTLAPGEPVPEGWTYYALPGSIVITVSALRSTGKGHGTLSATFSKPESSDCAASALDTVSANYFTDKFDPAAETYPFLDGGAARYRDAIRSLAGTGILRGFQDGTFSPKSGLTRAQGCAILARASGNGTAVGTAPFSDTSGHWAEGVIAWCAANGIVYGYGDGRFGPDDPLTGYAWVKMLFCTLGFDADTYGMNGFTWEKGVMDMLCARSLDQGMNNFYPWETIQREEACQLLYNGSLQGLISFPEYTYVADTDGSGVYMIGDSITFLSQRAIQDAMPNITINARSGIWFSRHTSEFGNSGTERIAEMGDQRILVFALGSNGGVKETDIDALFAALEGRNVKVILMTIYYSSGWAAAQMDSSNAIIRATAEKYDNVSILDWYATASEHPEYVQRTSTDHVHPTSPAGAKAFAETVKSAINTVLQETYGP